jgi:rare lipoprotein A
MKQRWDNTPLMKMHLKAALGGMLIFCAFTFGSIHTIAGETGQTTAGNASWYGGKFHGRTTANGERFDMHQLTAAHRSLPFGAKVRVTNQATKDTVVVRINDRGPYAGNRVIDLSHAAARAVRLIGTGVAPVTLEVLQGSG